MTVRTRIAMLLIAALAACDQEPVAAVLADASDETMDQLRSALASALGRASVTLGAGDVTAVPEVLVLPPALTPPEGNSPAMPIVFDILLLNGDCYVRRRGSPDLVALADVACNPAPA
ncbi:MAG: hypothetical protein ACO33A_08670 [Hyphomonas sp.]